MNKAVFCFVILIGFTLNLACASSPNITKDEFDNFTNSSKFEHTNILDTQKELQDITGKNSLALGDISKRLDKISANLTTISDRLGQYQMSTEGTAWQTTILSILIAVALGICTFAVSVAQMFPKQGKKYQILELLIVVLIIGILVGSIPSGLDGLPKSFDILHPHGDWLGWVIGIAGVIIGLLGFLKQKHDSKKTSDRENELIIDALRKYNHYIQQCRLELIRLRDGVNEDIQNGGNGMDVIRAELQSQVNMHAELFSHLDKETSFLRVLIGNRFHDALNNGIGAFRIVVESDTLTRFPTPEVWLDKIGESVEMIDHVIEKIETELQNRLPEDQLL